ncbi:MAG TPA: hypothetical protein PKH54_05550 [Myxococcota bacterium]|nr:hypothetical protein [Myxococcota bacterium]HOC99388.1 hypothetical protein [Myxococcota bacterium]HOH76742.1 hypothetical protein [Myxococcota bacterium]HPV03820.1 hypothetical protein [Myxococcota bacterium]
MKNIRFALCASFLVVAFILPAMASSGESPRPEAARTAGQSVASCIPSCDGRTCGPDGCGGACGQCRRGAACVTGRCVDGAVDVTVDYTGLVGDIFPTFIAHLLGSGPLNDVPLVSVKARNLSDSDRVPLSCHVDIPGFSAAGKSTINLLPGESRVIRLTPTLDFAALSRITTSTPSAVNVSIKTANSMIFEETRPIKLASKNSMFWSFPNEAPDESQPKMKRNHPLAPFLAAFVVPHDKDFLIRKLLKSASDFMPDKAMVGYQDVPLEPTEIEALRTSDFAVETIRPGANNVVQIRLMQIPGAGYPDVAFQVMDDANLAAWKAGQEAAVYFAQADAVAAGQMEFKSEADIDYHLVYSRGPRFTATSRVARVRTATHTEVVTMQASAIFKAMKALGVNYVNAPNDFFSTSQFIMYPSETLAQKTANCAEGALVFAAAFKALGLRAVLYLVPGHMFVGVRTWHNEDLIVPIETTMVASGEPDQAIEVAMDTVKKTPPDDIMIIDVDQMAAIGVVPWPL